MSLLYITTHPPWFSPLGLELRWVCRYKSTCKTCYNRWITSKSVRCGTIKCGTIMLLFVNLSISLIIWMEIKNPSITRRAFCVPTTRFERVTYGLEVRCSIQLSYEGINSDHKLQKWVTVLKLKFITDNKIHSTILRIIKIWI